MIEMVLVYYEFNIFIVCEYSINLCVHLVDEEHLEDADESEGTYFVDQSGQYYYQANSDSQPVMTVVQRNSQESNVVCFSQMHRLGKSIFLFKLTISRS